MSAEFNEWEAKSIESELDKIRAKYLMSPSDFDKSSTFKHGLVRQTGTFKIDKESVDTRNQSVDNYGNEVREFVIEHPTKSQFSSQYSLKQMGGDSDKLGNIAYRDGKENFYDREIIIENDDLNKRSYQFPKQNLKFANETNNFSNKNKIPVSEEISSRLSKNSISSRINLPEMPSTNDARIDSKINIELNSKFKDQYKGSISVK